MNDVSAKSIPRLPHQVSALVLDAVLIGVGTYREKIPVPGINVGWGPLAQPLGQQPPVVGAPPRIAQEISVAERIANRMTKMHMRTSFMVPPFSPPVSCESDYSPS